MISFLVVHEPHLKEPCSLVRKIIFVLSKIKGANVTASA
jgi:hypothetical protein